MTPVPRVLQNGSPLGQAIRTLVVAVGLCAACQSAAWADTPPTAALEMPPMCQADKGAPNPQGAERTEDCYEFGAAVGELGLGWRQKLPDQVRWLSRKDADTLCKQTQSELGQQVDGQVPGGCVFLAPNACTIVTAGHISPASLGNAVRHCVP